MKGKAPFDELRELRNIDPDSSINGAQFKEIFLSMREAKKAGKSDEEIEKLNKKLWDEKARQNRRERIINSLINCREKITKILSTKKSKNSYVETTVQAGFSEKKALKELEIFKAFITLTKRLS